MLALLLEGGAVGELRSFQVVDGGKVLVDQRGVGQGPQMFGWLQFGGVRRQKEQVDVLGHAQTQAAVPAGAIQHEHDLLGGTGPRLPRERGELGVKHGDADGRGEMKDGPAGGGMDEADQRAPGKAVLHGGDRPLANRRPAAPRASV